MANKKAAAPPVLPRFQNRGPIEAIFARLIDFPERNLPRFQNRGPIEAELCRTPPGANERSRYKKIVADIESIHETLIDLFIKLRSLQGTPEELIIDFDATDDPVHGDQLGKFFHGYYGHHCFLPLYAFCDGWPLVAQLRPANIDASAGTVEHLARIVPKLRAAWPGVKVIVRGDGGFCRESILHWCEENHVDYVIGLAKNDRLKKEIENERLAARMFYRDNREAARLFKYFEYQTLTSWSRKRIVVAKAEHLSKGENPRFVVTSLALARTDPQALYEQIYCARGEMENRIKEQQLMLFADRTSAHTMRANQLRLTFSTIAYLHASCTAKLRVERDGTRVGSGGDDPHAGAENRCPGQGHLSPHLGQTVDSPPRAADLRNNYDSPANESSAAANKLKLLAIRITPWNRVQWDRSVMSSPQSPPPNGSRQQIRLSLIAKPIQQTRSTLEAPNFNSRNHAVRKTG